jgi:16S rRNA (uracil1498-N3)-methyltransferase
MTRRRWIADEVNGETASLTGEHAMHLARVLRAKVGQEFDIVVSSGKKGDGLSDLRRGTITAISDSRVDFSLGEKLQKEGAAIPQITLVLAIFKFDRMEWAIEKCTEIGVSRIIPLIARRTDAHLVAAASKRHERWLRITKQAAEQSRRVGVPEITAPMKLQGLAEALPAAATRLVLAETLAGSQETGLTDILQSSSTGEAILAIGPEGGWTEDELTWFRQAGWIATSLGPTILRAETAAIVGSALAIDALR